MQTRMLEPVEAWVEEKIAGLIPGREEVLIRTSTDLEPDGHFGRQWVLVTPRRVVVVPERGADRAVEVPLAQVRQARTEPLVGGGRLEIECLDAPTLLVPYSASAATKFSELARGLEQLRQGEPLAINARLDRLR